MSDSLCDEVDLSQFCQHVRRLILVLAYCNICSCTDSDSGGSRLVVVVVVAMMATLKMFLVYLKSHLEVTAVFLHFSDWQIITFTHMTI